jgi:transcriptional regulator with XRE-family HTH domain
MTDLGNKEVMAKNLKRLMAEKNVTAKELSKTLNFPYTTVLSWLKGDNYPRIDKIEIMSDYFGVLKSDLIEAKKENPAENDGISPAKRAFLKQVEQMPDSDLARVIEFLRLFDVDFDVVE